MQKSRVSTGLKRPGRHRLMKGLVPYLYLSPTLVLLAVLSLIPIATVFTYSLLDNVIITRDAPTFVGISNYLDIISKSHFRQALQNTLVFAIASVIAHFILGLSFALLLNTNLIGANAKALFRVIYILPWVFTASIIAILWRLLLNPNGVVNYLLISVGLANEPIEWLSSRQLALQSVTFINIWAGYPFYMVSFLAGLQGIPTSLYEAAKIDGANGVQLFRYITLPQLKPIITSLAMLDFIWTTHQFTLIWMTTGGGPIRSSEVLSTYTYKTAFSAFQFSQASTIAMIILALTTFVAIFYVRNQRMAAE
ncbi:MAG: sugar ABC transporter permease [Trueperaceae bacterium]|nr:MAG: sugar ABC transporter permease [Trueperaceae bacterium]